MSIETWKEEFCPEKTSAYYRSRLDRVERDLKKWIGLRKKNLAKHELIKIKSAIHEPANIFSGISMSGSTCSLCWRYGIRGPHAPCRLCPLAIVRNGIACDEPEGDSPYSKFTQMSGDPEPMIRLLRKAKRMLEAKKGAKL